MKTTKSFITWNTTDEINFLNGMGEYDDKTKRLAPTEKVKRRKKLLLNAKEAYEKRVVWGDIKTMIVKQHLDMLIKKEVLNGQP